MLETTSPVGNSVAGSPESEILPTKNALVCFLAPRPFYRSTIVSTNEVFSGPDCRAERDDTRIRTLETPVGSYDLRDVVAQLPAAQKPELILVKADATGRNQPRHLDAFSCPKVLLVGDTHHQDGPIRSVLRYAIEEAFDLIVFDHTRQHAHFFVEAGLKNVHWIPAFDLSPHEQPWRDEVEAKVAFVGQVGRFHPYRQHVLQSLEQAGVKVAISTAPPEQTAQIYARSLINLNVSLNGDMNLRVFEVLAAGGLLMTDRLSMQSGLERLFRDGEHLVCYDGPEDLRRKIDHYLANPATAREIARRGRDEYLAHHRPATKIQALMDLLAGKPPAPMYRIEGERRAISVPERVTTVAPRIAVYEVLQELHRANPNPCVLFARGASAETISDATDLPRLQILVEESPGRAQMESLLAARGVPAGRVSFLNSEDVGAGEHPSAIPYQIAVVSPAAVMRGENDGILSRAQAVVVELEEIGAGGEALERRMKSHGFQQTNLPIAYVLTDRVVIGERAFAAGQHAQALMLFEEVLKTEPENVRALNNMGVISHAFGDTTTCLSFLDRALSLDRCNPETILNLAEVKLAQDLAAVATLCEHFDSLEVTSPALLDRRAQLQAALPKREPPARAVATSPLRRVLTVTNLYPPQELGGYGRLMHDFSNLLAARGHELSVLTSNTAYLGAPASHEPHVSRSLKLFGGWQQGGMFNLSPHETRAIATENAAELRRAIERFKPDVCLLGNLDFLGPLLVPALLECGIPIVHHLGNRLPGYVVEDTPRNPLYRLATCSRWLADSVRGDGFPLEKIDVVYPGARVSEFVMPAAPSRRRLRIAYASLVMPYKGAHVLVEALIKLAARGIDFTCTIAGGSTQPEYLAQLRDAIRKAGLEGSVEFPGNLSRPALKDLFGRSNVLVFPSQFEEPFGISQVEAMAAGLTVVSSGTGGASEIIENQVSGLLFDKASGESLANALERLTKDRERWSKIATAGQARAMTSFDIERSVDQLEATFSELLGLKGQRRN